MRPAKTVRLVGYGLPGNRKLDLAPHKTIVDLLPAGPGLRRKGSILWPASQFTLSLAGFYHVFASAVELDLTEKMRIRIAPPIVTVLLKMIAYMEDPYRRVKDLQDIRVVLGRYEADSDRLFSEEVLDADLPDFNVANAFLVGVDLRAVATKDDAECIRGFLERFLEQGEEGEFGPDKFATKTLHSHVRALRGGFTGR